MQNKLILYTKNDCKYCDNVKEYLKTFVIPEGLLEIRNIHNDLVQQQRLKDGVVIQRQDKTGNLLEETDVAMSFPALEIIDKATLTTVALFSGSENIINTFSQLGLRPLHPVEAPKEERYVDKINPATGKLDPKIEKIGEPDCEACQ